MTRCYTFAGHDKLPFEQARDTSLWNDSGDCFIYLDADIAAYRLPLTTLHENHATVLLKTCRPTGRTQSPKSCDSSDSGYESSHLNRLSLGPCEIHISVPVGLSAKAASLYHITTRNYFAYLTKEPLVGTSLGLALRDVWQRIQRWHGDEADVELFLEYCTALEYTTLTGSPHNATALLAFAESARLRTVWINAFAHCVGMHDRISKDSDFDILTNTTKALITKASLEMELHIRRVVRAIGNFLEGELSSEKLGISKPARDHLDHFRSFLQSYFLDRLGYFPPSDSEDNFDKDIWRDIHDDFRHLYDYLADTETVSDTFSDRGVIGGVCVHQNVDAFNQRHSFEPLPHPLPLLPDLTPTRRTTESQVSLRNFLVRVESDFRPSLRQALTDASNSHNPELVDQPIVQDYIRFERQRLEEKLSIAEARKVRWLLIYCTLQMLISITTAPDEVAEAQSAPYPLCVNVSACPIWPEKSVPLPRTSSVASIKQSNTLTIPIPEDDTDRISIHPDCEADNAQDFFSHQWRSSVADKSEDEDPQSATRTTAPTLTRSLSIRTSVSSSMNVFSKTIGGLSRRSSSRKSVQLTPKKKTSLQSLDAQDEVREDDFTTDTPTIAEGFTFDFADKVSVPDSPILEDHHLDMLVARPVTPTAEPDEHEQLSPVSDTSRRSSTHSEYDTPITEPSSRSSSTRESRLMGKLAPLDEDSILITPNERARKPFHTSASSSSLNIGCYTPTGYTRPDAPVVPMSKFAAPQRRQVFERRHDEQVRRPLQARYGRSRSHTVDHSARYTYGDMP
ncbi:hypothetical protein AMS68_002155 [Peltaster fructicola]|uniref:DUF8004 domain-containing protein n=1 Tax=Peltaster fructicola TaxID=286661 RepID=A0A6H0XPS7_9PEZI|nr:hypothetical protein AMS68_002155 [Peltaster fructicola]